LFTEHSMDVVFGYADRILVLARGQLIAEGNADEIREHPEVRKVYFGSGTTFAPKAAGRARRHEEDRDGASDIPRPALLTVQALNAWYGAAHILRDVSLEARRGEVVALLGRNGAGKSTTLKAIMGLAERRAASLEFMGHALAHRQPFEIARLGLGYVPEDRRIFTDLTVTENLMAGRQAVRVWPQIAAQDAGRERGSETLDWSLAQIFDVF